MDGMLLLHDGTHRSDRIVSVPDWCMGGADREVCVSSRVPSVSSCGPGVSNRMGCVSSRGLSVSSRWVSVPSPGGCVSSGGPRVSCRRMDASGGGRSVSSGVLRVSPPFLHGRVQQFRAARTFSARSKLLRRRSDPGHHPPPNRVAPARAAHNGEHGRPICGAQTIGGCAVGGHDQSVRFPERGGAQSGSRRGRKARRHRPAPSFPNRRGGRSN